MTDGPQGQVTLQDIAMPADANVGGDMFGGWLMSMMDLGASVIARQRARGRTATVACHELRFLKPVYVGDLVANHAWLIREGRTSMRIGVCRSISTSEMDWETPIWRTTGKPKE